MNPNTALGDAIAARDHACCARLLEDGADPNRVAGAGATIDIDLLQRIRQEHQRLPLAPRGGQCPSSGW